MWVIEDWNANRMFPEQTWNTYQSAWDFVHANCPEEDWEDIYVVTKKSQEYAANAS